MFIKTRIILVSTLILLTTLFSCNNQQEQKVSEAQNIVQSTGISHPEWSKNSIIYEVNIRQYTPQGTFAAFEEHLPRLKELGVDILWLMPIYPVGIKNRKGTLGSYYSVKDYTKVNPEFGNMHDFKSLVQSAHDMGFKVILDWVANHSAWDNPWMDEHPEWYTRDSLGQIVSPYDWTDVADLNFDEQPLWDAMISSLEYWVTEADVDGFRCDVAEMVPTAFWDQARTELDKIKPVFMLAEAEKAEHHENAFDMSYAWELHHVFNQMAKGEKNADDLEVYMKKNNDNFSSDDYRMVFLTNHDENSWNGTIEERIGDAAPLYSVLMYTLPGMPLIYSGQEVGLNRRLEFFEKDEINWDLSAPQLGLYTRLNTLKKNNEALWNGDFGGSYLRLKTDGGNQVMAFIREKGDNKIVVIANISNEAIVTSLTDETIVGDYTDYFTGEDLSLLANEPITLEPLGYLIYIGK